MVIVKDLSVKVHNHYLLESVSCSLQEGRITTFIGKSGAGKTTLLKAFVGLVPVTTGHIMINDKQLSTMSPRERSEAIGYVFQDFNLFPHLTVLENCIDPLLVHNIPYDQARSRAIELLQELEMIAYIDKYPSELSGGQQQRVAIARCLCLKPRVILLDEPTASLDPFNTEILITILRRLAAQGLIIGLSSQDMMFTRKIFDRVYYVRDGTIVEFCDGIAMLERSSIIKQFMLNA